jgi:hypothetical protein
MKTKAGKSIADFREAHDPTYELLSPTTTYARDLPKGVRRFIVTAAQNATPIHEKWWGCILSAARELNAEIMVIPTRYKNPTSRWTGSQQNMEHWDAAVRPYLWNARKALNKNLTLLADMKIQPTASSPLTGADALSLASSGIIGHTKLQLRCIPTPQNRMAKVLTTTGACTVPNYTDSRTGKIGEFHHSLSAVLVELDGSKFHLRHLHFDQKTATATDLGTRYGEGGASKAPRPLALDMGDTHVDYIDPEVERATFGEQGLVQKLQPQHIVWHDLLDSYSCNPHHEGNPFNAVAKRLNEADDVRKEVERAIEFVRVRTLEGSQSVIVRSNHNDFLQRWIQRRDWRSDPTNAEFYLGTALAMVKGTKLTVKGTEFADPFEYWFNRAAVPNARILQQDESFVLGDVELGMHGDQGPNGARGSIKNLRRIGLKSIIGHSHTPGIDEGCYQVGTSTRLRLEYNHGASSWLNTHCLLHADGKRQLINIIDGKYTI